MALKDNHIIKKFVFPKYMQCSIEYKSYNIMWCMMEYLLFGMNSTMGMNSNMELTCQLCI